ncbi:PilZ domain-containing protein [Aureimonas mangrovi]|uniref:PilZ domain-containing protein n=1 Tax=Aureimonas mangrovi TaxID=2758041 RepID=UPI00163DA126|nr:PilZ domain-containing protein [Aureimonas mangrovi]
MEGTIAAEEHDERRVSPRLRTLKRARVLFNNRFSTIDCVVRNVSKTGALLTVDTAVHLPKTFEVMITGDNNLRPAKLVYRRETFAGIHFLDAAPEEDMEALPAAPAAAVGDGSEGEVVRIVPQLLPSALAAVLPWRYLG